MPTPNEISERLGRVLSSICCVQTDGNPLGTGFLVGPDVVLTNYHVIERIMDPPGKLTKPVTCVFDYLKLRDGSIQAGKPFKVEECLDSSPYGEAESGYKINDPMPTEEELDYALLRLDQRVGEMQLPERLLQHRGWIDMWDTPWDTEPPLAKSISILTKDNRVIVVQHPLGAPQEYKARNYLGENALCTRMRYELMTAVGSSGSPCLTEEYKLFALHHLGDAGWNAVAVSQGVPIKLIRERIAKKDPAWIPKFNILADAKQLAPWSGLFRVLAQYPQAKAAIRDSREKIKTITDRTADLQRHKAIHDVLGILQLNLPQLQTALDDPDQKRSREGVRMAARTMRDSWRSLETEANQLKEAGKARGFGEEKWIDEFSNALTSLVEAEQIVDKWEAAQTIQMHLRYRPSDLNGKIRQILGDLPVEELLNVFSDVIKAMDLRDTAFVGIVRSGPDLLRRHWDALRQNVADHNAWQYIDNELAMLESLQGGKATTRRSFVVGWRSFEVGWRRAWSKALALCEARATEKWSIDMQRHAEIVAADIANKQWNKIGEHFAEFRSDMTQRFGQVDKSLLSGSQAIIELGNPLRALVEASL